MTTPTALNAEYRKAFPAKFATRRDGTPNRCIACAEPIVLGDAFTATHDFQKYDNYCGACSVDMGKQIEGLYHRLQALVDGLTITDDVREAVLSVRPFVQAFVANENRDTFLAAKASLFAARTVIGQARKAAAPAGLDLTVLPSGKYAVPGGDTRLKLQIDVVEKGKWAGWVFVKDAAAYGQGSRYGSQRPGQSYKGRIEAELRAIVADPAAAMHAYGALTGQCCFCHLPLEKRESVRRGYGPTCADNRGLPFDHQAYNAE